MEKLVNKNKNYTAVITDEAMAIVKNLYEYDNDERDYKVKQKRRIKTFNKNVHYTVSGGYKWVNEDYIVYENRFRIPVADVYHNGKLILTNQPIYFGNYELRTNFKVGEEIHFSAKMVKFDEFSYSNKGGYEQTTHYVNKDRFEIEFEVEDSMGIFEREFGDIYNMKYEFQNTKLDKGTNIWKR